MSNHHYGTHSLGSMCSGCKQVLVEDDGSDMARSRLLRVEDRGGRRMSMETTWPKGDPCPMCGHSLNRDVHDAEDGCTVGWEYDARGLVSTDGCDCPLTMARYA